jgi:hypothetical protein
MEKDCLKVTGHPFWRFVENRYCALKISPIFIKFSPNVSRKLHVSLCGGESANFVFCRHLGKHF